MHETPTEEKTRQLDAYLGVRVSADDKRLLQELSGATRIAMSELARRAIHEFLSLRNSQGPVEESP